MILLVVRFDFMSTANHSQDSHSRRKPELLRAHEVEAGRVPLARVGVVAVAEDDEYPSAGEAKPANEPVVAAICSTLRLFTGADDIPLKDTG